MSIDEIYEIYTQAERRWLSYNYAKVRAMIMGEKSHDQPVDCGKAFEDAMEAQYGIRPTIQPKKEYGSFQAYWYGWEACWQSRLKRESVAMACCYGVMAGEKEKYCSKCGHKLHEIEGGVK